MCSFFRLLAFLTKHNVEHSDLAFCDPDVTHVIAHKLARSEKMLGSIATGKWILHPSYFEACNKQDRFLVSSN